MIFFWRNVTFKALMVDILRFDLYGGLLGMQITRRVCEYMGTLSTHSLINDDKAINRLQLLVSLQQIIGII